MTDMDVSKMTKKEVDKLKKDFVKDFEKNHVCTYKYVKEPFLSCLGITEYHGLIVVVTDEDATANDKVRVTWSVCNKKDNFSKYHGKYEAMRRLLENPNDMFPEVGKIPVGLQSSFLKVAKRALSEVMMKKVDFDDLQSVYLVYNQKEKNLGSAI
jgi:hypothetical protein